MSATARPPVVPGESLAGRVVLARVGERYWLHRATAEDQNRVHIAGDNGMVNGWTSRDLVFGVLTEDEPTARVQEI